MIDRITQKQLRAFVEVGRLGSLAAAAGELGVSPSAVSEAISSLEKALGGVALHAKAGRSVELTHAGKVFNNYARQLVALLEQAVDDAIGGSEPGRGRVRLGAVTTIGEHVLPGFLASFRVEHPHAEVSLEVGNRDRIWDLLRHREIDLALGGRPPVADRFESLAERPNWLVLVAANKQQPSNPPPPVSISREQLQSATVLLREHGSGTRQAAERFLRDLRLSPPTLTIGSNGAIRACVQAGLGIALLNQDAVALDVEAGTLAELQLDDHEHGIRPRRWRVLAQQASLMPTTVALFLSHLARPVAAGTERFELTSAGQDVLARQPRD